MRLFEAPIVQGVLENPAIVGLIVGLPAFILGCLAYLRSRNVDAVAEQAGAASHDIEQVGQVIDGLNKLIANLQEDNKNLRLDILDLRLKMKDMGAIIDVLEHESRSARKASRSS
jgi:hypothetical protein